MPKLNKLRDKARDNQGGKCWYCGCPMLPASDNDPARCTAEHLRARCDGGKDVLENIVAACWLCNNRRHRRKLPLAPEEYRELVRNRLSSGRWIASRSSKGQKPAGPDVRF
ncbi:HNH endonuclease signature motif containing protein [Devosia sp.]|uniref:HNH endonuclease n=1 Tax=Devosia sp. TaxID=1871048 RepID=UPI001AC4A366|nr:HNH endonuclease [Devosia sp.]